MAHPNDAGLAAGVALRGAEAEEAAAIAAQVEEEPRMVRSLERVALVPVSTGVWDNVALVAMLASFLLMSSALLVA